MATLDKQSLREEARRIQLEFERLAESSKIDNDVKMLFHSMFMLINLLVAIFLEKTTKKTNKNSGKPSSQTQKDDSALDMTGSKSKGNAENLLMATNSRTLESTTVICVDACDHCGESLANTTCCCIERRTKIDILFEKHVEHFDAEVKECPSCHAKVKGTFPDDVSGALQYGNGIKALAICLMTSQMVAVKRVQNMLKTLIGTVISEATLLNYILRLHQALAPWALAAKEQLLQQRCIHTDETSLRVEKKNYWIHVYSSGAITLKCLHRKRGAEAMQAITILLLSSSRIITVGLAA